MADTEQEWLNVSEAAELLGVSRPTIYKLMDKGLLPYQKIKGIQGRRIKRDDLEILLQTYNLEDEEQSR
ncbi:MAG: DNA-binding protein [Chloroflexi bacterium]|nr:DNA-binding protein [Chloroflexota bacterium]